MKTRHLKVYQGSYPHQDVPKILLQGKWLEGLGFTINESIEVSYSDGCLIIKLPDIIDNQ